MGTVNKKLEARLKRKKRIRKKIEGTLLRPRLTVFRSNQHIYAQIIDDSCGHTLVAVSSCGSEIKENKEAINKLAIAALVGKIIAKKAIDKKIESVVFDRNGYLYHGRVKALSIGAREGGLIF
ncbi:MAG: 50S ribosomal protein L18 [Desulfobacterales bacterium]|nr:50S ribosomal protein L18 [Desulfobacterales bacterium]